MHSDVRYRGNLAVDLMEPLRSLVDEMVLDLVEQRELLGGYVLETRRGVCRLGPTLAQELAERGVRVSQLAGLLAEDTAAFVLGSPVRMPLTRIKHRAAIARRGAKRAVVGS